MYHTIRSYVPEEFKNDPLYAKPSEQERATAKATKQDRLTHRAAMATAAKLHQDQRELSEKDPEHKNGAAVQKKRMATPKKAASTKNTRRRQRQTNLSNQEASSFKMLLPSTAKSKCCLSTKSEK
ncbi:unnamed protein product [Phytophthora lilii]|uniref:Unnamed protein product n=1 Tax=Phytophthora lilii TaxID=2077276 RepID=A0A9W6U1G2_9STRA|nr:unnamed protein product [Phytophthora lilii]